LLDDEAAQTARNLAARRDDVYLGSAVTGQGLDALLARADVELRDALTDTALVLPFEAGRARAWLHEAGAVLSEATEADGVHLTLRWTDRQAARFRAAFPIPPGQRDG
ncbi:MAG: hypothetical protein AAF390_12515, partial [Pseudomonadota bacterium]